MTTYTAVLDRIVDDEHAVVLLEAEGETVDELTVALSRVPDAGSHEGAVFEATVVDGSLEALTYESDAERERRETAQDRFDSLSERLDEE